MNTLSVWPIDHIGIAVTDLNAAIAWYMDTTNAQVSLRETIEEQGVTLAFLETPTTKIELLAPTREQSSLGRFLTKRGPGLHHICYRVTEITVRLQELKARGITLIDEVPRHGAGGTMIAFLHPNSCLGTLTELCEYPAS